MLPQNGQQRGGQGGPGGFGGFNMGETGYFNLDPSQAAKQMAALTAAKQARMGGVNPRPSSSAGGTSSGPYFGGTQHATDLLSAGVAPHARFQPLLEPSMSQQPANPRQRQQGFLHGLHNLMASRGQPLPPQLTGVPVPNYDHSNSPWSAIEPGSEVGTFKLAGRDVNLFKLWGLVFSNGGAQALTANNAWVSILPQLDLPDEFPSVQANGSNSVATMIHQYYMVILYPFEEQYRRSLQENQRKANLANRQAMMPNVAIPGSQPMTPQGMPQNNPAQMQRGTTPMAQGMIGGTGPPRYPSMPPQQQQPHSRPPSGVLTPTADGLLPTPESNLLDQDGQGIKRKLDTSDLESKRARPRTGDPQPGSPMSMPAIDRHPSETPSQVSVSQMPQPPAVAPPRPRQQPSRRKIEYIPLAREVETYGGWDLRVLEAELAHGDRRQLRDLNDWGTVDIECLTMSIRSRLGVELSYALTTFTLLSTMRGPTQGSGFPIFQCPDLLEETLDLIEDIAFDGLEDSDTSDDGSSPIVTHPQLVNSIIDEQSLPFAGLDRRQGSKDPEQGPQQRPANYILAGVNIIRNLASVPDNIEFLGRRTRMFDVILRVCKAVVGADGVVNPASPVLSLNDLVMVRKDVLYTLSTLAAHAHLTTPDTPSLVSRRIARRAFELTSSYIVDPVESVPPFNTVQQIGNPPFAPSHLKPPVMVDVALEAVNRLIQPDNNRRLLVKSVSQAWLWTLFSSLVHRLPISDADFQLMGREPWLAYLEKVIMSIYSLAFMAPLDLKHKMRSDKGLRFKAVMARLLHRFLNNSHDGRIYYLVCARRATESLKVLDRDTDALEDPFENQVDAVGPATLSFGMGFADAADSGQEKGTGLLGAHRDLAWELLMFREVQNDDVMFNELESLIRVDYQ